METAHQTQSCDTFKIGPDRITLSGPNVIIDARHEMPDWQVREFSRIPIYFRDQKYFLRQKTPNKRPYAIRYLLEPWPKDNREIARSSLAYDEESVTRRESELRGGRIDEIIRVPLLLLYPFLGMLWSGTKQKLIRFGFVPRTITGLSIFFTLSLVVVQGTFAKLLIFTTLRSHQVVMGGMLRAFIGHEYVSLGPLQIRVLWLDVVLLLALLSDCVIRYSQHLREVESPWGFLEWLTCLLPRKKPVPITLR